jgi:hypothetical protein
VRIALNRSVEGEGAAASMPIGGGPYIGIIGISKTSKPFFANEWALLEEHEVLSMGVIIAISIFMMVDFQRPLRAHPKYACYPILLQRR